MRRIWVVVLLGVGLGACDGTTTPDGEQLATLNVAITDNPESKVAFAPHRTAWLAHHKNFGANYFHGRLLADLQLAISKNGRDWISLGSPTSVDFQLQVEEGQIALGPSVEVPAGTYGYLRLTGSDGETRVEPGARIGGQTLDAPVSLELGQGGGLVVEMRLSSPIFLVGGSRTTLAVDLNSEAWLSEENIEAGRIPATDVETAISVTPLPILPTAIVPPRGGSV